MSVHVTPLTEQQCKMKEKLFLDAYGLETTIAGVSYNDENWDWDKAIIKFCDSLGKNYGLVENFKPGTDNSTDFVELEYENKEGSFVKQKFEKFLDAELAMVELMKKRLKGED